MTLPVTPEKYQVTTAQGNKTYTILDAGEVLVFGNQKLKTLKFAGFFPALKHEYSFVVGDRKEPSDCIALIGKWKESKSPVRVIITDSPVNLMMAIMEFDLEEKDGTRDIYYKLSFKEYRELNTPQANNEKVIEQLTGLRERPEEESKWTDPNKALGLSFDAIEFYRRVMGSCGGFNDFRLEHIDLGLDNFEINPLIIDYAEEYA